jgi:hypothetical protein
MLKKKQSKKETLKTKVKYTAVGFGKGLLTSIFILLAAILGSLICVTIIGGIIWLLAKGAENYWGILKYVLFVIGSVSGFYLMRWIFRASYEAGKEWFEK